MYTLLSGLINGMMLATALAAGVGLALSLTPRRILNAATRYVIWWITLAAVILIPIIPALHRSLPVARTLPVPAQTTLAYTPIPVPRAAAIPISVPTSMSESPWPVWPLYLWPLVSMVFFGRLAISLIRLTRLKSRARPLRASRIAQWLTYCQGARHGIRLAVSSEIATPIATGPHRPTILLPARLVETLTGDDLDRIGLHETAHLVRRDDIALLLQRVLEALFFPYPLIYWIARRIDLEREIACDDLVIAATGRPRTYAACLTRIVESCSGIPSPWPTATAAADISQLSRRVDALLDKTRRAGAHLMRAPLAAITATLLFLVLLTGRAPALIAFVATTVESQTVRLLPANHRSPLLLLPAQTKPGHPEDLAGLVTEDHSGKPVSSAELRLHKPGLREMAADLETDSHGHFGVTGLAPGQYSVEVVKPNYAGTHFQLTVPAPNVSVRLVRYGIIDGLATNAAGQPLPGTIRGPGGRSIGFARVTVLTKDAATGRLETIRDMPLEDGGRFRVHDLMPGRYVVGFWYSGQNEGSGMQLYPDNTNPRVFSVAGGEEYDGVNFVVSARSSAQIGGTLAIPEGVSGQFQLALGLPDQPLVPLSQTLSEKDGTFRFEKIPAGSYDLFVAGPVGGYGQFSSTLRDKSFFGRARVQTSGQNIEGLSIPVSAAKTMRVVLRAAGGGPLPDGCPGTASVTVSPLEPWAIMYFPGAEVSFGKEQTIPNLAPGRFRATLTNPGNTCFQTNDATADLSADDPGVLAIEFAAAGSVHGSDAPSGSVVLLTAANATDSGQARAAYPDAAGHFLFEGLPPARYRIVTHPAGQNPRTRWVSDRASGQLIEVAGGKPTEVEIAK